MENNENNEMLSRIIKTLYIAQEAILRGNHDLTPQMENALVEIRETLHAILRTSNENK